MPYECPRCERVSGHAVDEIVGWCPGCADFTRDAPERTLEIIDELHAAGRHALAGAIRRRLHYPGSPPVGALRRPRRGLRLRRLLDRLAGRP